jgi:hypothetical protein
VLNQLPPWLAGCLDARLTHSGAVDKSLFNMLRPSVARGFSLHRLREFINEVQQEVKDDAENMWLLQLHHSTASIGSYCKSSKAKPDLQFSLFDDREKYDGTVPSTKWLTSLYSRDIIQSHSRRIRVRARMFPLQIVSIDDSFKTPKHMAKRNGIPMFGTLRAVATNHGHLPMLQLQSTKSQLLTKHGLKEIEDGRKANNFPPTEVAYTDNPRTDKSMLEECLPSLKNDLVPPQCSTSYSHDLEALTLPSDVVVHNLRLHAAIEEAMEPIIEAVNSDREIVVGLDAEWNYTTRHGPGKLAVLQIAFKKTVLVLQLHCLKKLPPSICQLISHPNILKVGRQVGGDIAKLCRDWWPQSKEQMKTFKNSILELGSYCKNKKVKVSRNGASVLSGRASLADLVAAVLQKSLRKDETIRGSDWEMDKLSETQIEYAALDAWSSLEVYLAVSQQQTRGTFTHIVGEKVSLLSMDHRFEIAIGTFNGYLGNGKGKGKRKDSQLVNISISEILLPNAIVTKSTSTSMGEDLNSFFLKNNGVLPLTVHIERSRIKAVVETVPKSVDPALCSPYSPCEAQIDCSQVSASNIPSLFDIPPSDDDEDDAAVDELEPLLHDADAACEMNRDMDDILDPSNFDRDQNLEIVAADVLGKLAQEPWMDIVRSRVCADVFHLMKHVKAYTTHALYKQYLGQLRDAFLIKCEEDVLACTAALAGFDPPVSFDEKYHQNPGWCHERIRRWIPPLEILYARVESVFKVYGSLQDPKSNKSLFNETCWKQAGNVLYAIKQGWVSDPPGVQLYEDKYRDKLGLMVRCCWRGTNFLEGGLHRNVHKNASGYNMGPRLSVCFLDDYHGRHCIKMEHYRRTGRRYGSHFNYELKDNLHGLYTLMGLPLPHPLRSWINSSFYSLEPATTIGIAAIPSAVQALYFMEPYTNHKANPLEISSEEFVARQQNLKFPAFPIHTREERGLFKKLMLNLRKAEPHVIRPNYFDMASTWNQLQEVDGKKVFYKLPDHLENYFDRFGKARRVELAKAQTVVQRSTLAELSCTTSNVTLRISSSRKETIQLTPDLPVLVMDYNVLERHDVVRVALQNSVANQHPVNRVGAGVKRGAQTFGDGNVRKRKQHECRTCHRTDCKGRGAGGHCQNQ